MPVLLITSGDAAQQIAVDKPVFKIGKRRTNNLALQDTNVSREHCEIVAQGEGYILRDLGSRNGTFLNGHRVQEAPLLDGSVIQCSGVQMTFYIQPPSGVAQPLARQAASLSASRGGGLPAAADDDGQTPIELKQKVHAELLKDMDLKQTDFTKQSEEELYRRTTEVVTQIITRFRTELPPWLTPEALLKEIVDEALGLGPLEDLLDDEEIDEIMVNAWDKIYVEKHGRIERAKKRFTGDPQVVAVIRRIIAPIGRRIDETNPMVDARLPDGSRVNAIISPLSLTGPTLTIRKFATDPFMVGDLIGFGSMTPVMARFIEICVRYRANILISGGTGSGKTVLLNVCSSFIPEDERIVTIEDAAELKLHQEHVISLESKPPNIEGEGAIPIRKLVMNSLRMRPDRIVIGECRGAEALDMLQAMNTGHDGSLTTLHANSPRDALNRLETLVLMAGMELPSMAIRDQIVGALNFIIQTSRMPDGSRKMTHISEMRGERGDEMDVADVFLYVQTGFTADGKVEGHFTATGEVPLFIKELRARGIEAPDELFLPTKPAAAAVTG